MRFSWMRRPHRRTVALVPIALLALFAFSACSTGQTRGITSEAHEMHGLYLFVMIMGAIVGVLVEGAIIYSVIRYRRKNNDLPVQTHGSTPIEILWTAIPILIVVALFAYSFIVLRNVEHSETPADLTVAVEGFQWQWAFTYNMNDLGTKTDPNAKGSFTVQGLANKEPTLVIPVDEPVEFTLKSNDVIHAFFIKDFLYKLDVIPGRDNKFTVTPRQTGEFIGQCAEFCGLNHALMRFHVKIVTRAEFDQWVTEQNAASNKAVSQPAATN
jgi:cytochrome c oxidase subunit II